MPTLKIVPRVYILPLHHDSSACYSRPHKGKGPCLMLSQWSLLKDHPKGTGSSSRGPRFSSQHPNGSSQTPVIPIPDNPIPSAGLHSHTCRQKWQNVHTRKNKFKKDYPKEHDKLSRFLPTSPHGGGHWAHIFLTL